MRIGVRFCHKGIIMGGIWVWGIEKIECVFYVFIEYTMSFSKEQQYAFSRFVLGENLFITGPGGTGKTHLIKEMVKSMRERGLQYQVCAMTGCASVLLGLGAKTLHSWCGMGLANGHKDEVIHKIVYNKKTVGGLRKTRVLIVDEVSMMSKFVFEVLNSALKIIRKSTAAFGGVQVIFTGDFFQLPPVGRDEETSRFCFESPEWCKVFPLSNHIQLSHIFRQDDDLYKRVLEQVRWGEIDDESVKILQTCLRKEVVGEVIPTKLFAVRAKTDFVNTQMYKKLEGEEHIYKFQIKFDLKTFIESEKAIDLGVIERCKKLSDKEKLSEAEILVNQTNRVHILELKRGARVMCLHNICVDEGICNGSQGIVVDFVGSNFVPVVLFSNGRRMDIEPIWIQSDEYPCIGVGQIPLCLAWALTIHKIQGATLSIAEMDLGNSVFEYGQTYVALSRIKSLGGLYLSAFQPKRIKANPIVKEFYNQIPKIDMSQIEDKEIENKIEVAVEAAATAIERDNIFREFACEVKDPSIKVIRL